LITTIQRLRRGAEYISSTSLSQERFFASSISFLTLGLLVHLNRQLVRPNVVQSASPDTIRTAHGEFNLYPKLIVFPAKDLPGQIPEVSYSTIRELHVEENRLRKPGSVQIHGLRVWTCRNVVWTLLGQSRSHTLDRNAQSISHTI